MKMVESYILCPMDGSLQTNVKTDFKRFLIRDDSVLEMPPSKQLWLIFSLVVLVGIILSLLFLTNYSQDSDLNIGYLPSNIGVILFIIIAIPLWIIGFFPTCFLLGGEHLLNYLELLLERGMLNHGYWLGWWQPFLRFFSIVLLHL